MLGNMFSTKFVRDLFHEETNVVWDLATGTVGIKTKDGIFSGQVVTEAQGEVETSYVQISQNVLEDFSMPIPAFSMKVPAADVKVGDIISGENIIGFVEKVNGDGSSFDVRKLNGQLTSGYRPPKVNVAFTGGEVRVIRNLLNFGGSTPEQGAGFLGNLQSNPLLLTAVIGGKSDKLKDILPMLLLGGLNQGSNGNGFGGNMLQTIMMMKLLGKGKDSSLEDDLFGL